MPKRKSTKQDAIERARQEASIELLPAECHLGFETAAFDVVVYGFGLVGRWVQIREFGGRVTWTDGSDSETGGCDGDPEAIIKAVRKSLPAAAAALAYTTEA